MKIYPYIFIILFLTLSCKKIKPYNCQLWEVTDAKSNAGNCIDWSCAGIRTYNLYFCNDGLKDAIPGNVVVLSEDDCCRRTRTFNRRIE
ncbi:MAG TPA: hypothetical protein VGD17_11325 [Chitinophagaceae bacterium]